MKKRTALALLAAGCALLLAGCDGQPQETVPSSAQEASVSPVPAESFITEEEYQQQMQGTPWTFTGVILEADTYEEYSSILVEGETRSGDLTDVFLVEEAQCFDEQGQAIARSGLHVGQEVEVTCIGGIAESYPGQTTGIGVRVLGEIPEEELTFTSEETVAGWDEIVPEQLLLTAHGEDEPSPYLANQSVFVGEEVEIFDAQGNPAGKEALTPGSRVRIFYRYRVGDSFGGCERLELLD